MDELPPTLAPVVAAAPAVLSHRRPRYCACGLLGLLISGAVAAAELTPPLARAHALAAQFPPGSLTTRERAAVALTQALDIQDLLQQRFEAQSRHCYSVFFVNHCLDAARRDQHSGQHDLQRVILEAHDLDRRLQAQAHARDREDALRRATVEELERPQREQQAQAEARLRLENAAARARDAAADLARAAQDSAAAIERARAQQADLARQAALRPGLEAAAQRDLQDKQVAAAAYARTRAQDKEANAQRRAERQAARAAQAADDEKKAQAAAAAAAHPPPP